jgi:glutamate-1-semialdehyde 2,1-aminomutase
MGCVLPNEGYLESVRKITRENDVLLIFDEVITGFRLTPGGAQQYFGVEADITVLGKILGGGFPIGAFCGRKEIMERLDTIAFQRPKYSFQGGTFVANPITMTAGLATLKLLEDGRLINKLNNAGTRVRRELSNIFQTCNIDVQLTGAGSIFNTHFTTERVKDAVAAYKADRRRLTNYELALMTNGLFFLPTHNGVLSTEHSEADIEKLFAETENYAKRTRLAGN